MFRTVGESNNSPKGLTFSILKLFDILLILKLPTLSWLESLQNWLPKSSRKNGVAMNVIVQQKITCRTCKTLVAIREGFAGFPIQTIYRDECQCPTNSFRIDVQRSPSN